MLEVHAMLNITDRSLFSRYAPCISSALRGLSSRCRSTKFGVKVVLAGGVANGRLGKYDWDILEG